MNGLEFRSMDAFIGGEGLLQRGLLPLKKSFYIIL